MSDITRRSPAGLKPLSSKLSPEVRAWVEELRMLWVATGFSMNRFARLYPVIDKGTISRYLGGQRVPRDHWFLDTLLAILADADKEVTPEVREHLTRLQLAALETAHPHEYRVRVVTDELELAVTGLQEAEAYARSLEEQLAERNRRIHELIDDKGRLRAAWDADRMAMQAEKDRLEQEVADLDRHLIQARRRSAEAEERCRRLEEELNHLEASRPGASVPGTVVPSTDAPRGNRDSSRIRRELLTVTMLLALLTVLSASADTAAPTVVPPPPAGFSLTWSDDFNGARGTGLDTDAWRYDTGTNSGTGEIDTATNSTDNVFQDGNGHLVLKALHSGSDPHAGWTSGRVETKAAGFGARPGGVVMVQASIQQPNVTTTNGVGYWPAFSMLGAPIRTQTPYPTSGAVGILEDVNGRSSVFSTLHCGTGVGGPCDEPVGLGIRRACGGCQTAFHTYAVQIDRSVSPERIRWYLDGTNYFTVTANRVKDATAWTKAVDHPFSIIFNLAMGGGLPGGPNASTVSGGQLKIDYIAVYNKAT